MAHATRVEDLAQYGRGLDNMPTRVIARQSMFFVTELRRRYGTAGVARTMWSMRNERREILKTYADAVESLRRDWGRGAVTEALTMTALFRALTPVEGRDGAYEVAKAIFEQVAPMSMKALYQSDDLTRCDGDRFENFKTFHLALFDSSKNLFPNTQTDENDLFTSTVTKCSNVEVFTALGCPELARLGCDHDLAGYPAIADRHDFEFRRPATIAKGDDDCQFRFYRQGTAPDTEVIHGVPAHWEDSLNR